MNNFNDKIKVIYNNQAIEIDTVFTISDFNIEESIKGLKNYKLYTANIISSHSNGKLSREDIYSIDNSIIDNFIEEFIKSDKLLNKNYKIIDVEDKYEKFILSIEKTKLDYSKNISEIIYKKLSPNIINFGEAVSKTFSKNSIEINNITEKFNHGIIKHLEPIKKIQSGYSNYIKKTMKPLNFYNGQFEKLISIIRESIKNIKIPTITEEDKEKLLENYSMFGKLGWTIPPYADLYTFNKLPQNGDDAYKILKEYTNKENIENLFVELSQIKGIKKSDLNEAIECFKNRHYKACALIIFSIIDAKLIRSQPRKIESKRYRRPAGKRAIKKLFENIEMRYIEETMLFTQLYQVNILEALKTVFEDANDFKQQPNIINRNFLTHGMMHRKVYRRDCVMLFFLLFNFYQYINSFIEY